MSLFNFTRPTKNSRPLFRRQFVLKNKWRWPKLFGGAVIKIFFDVIVSFFFPLFNKKSYLFYFFNFWPKRINFIEQHYAQFKFILLLFHFNILLNSQRGMLLCCFFCVSSIFWHSLYSRHFKFGHYTEPVIGRKLRTTFV